MNIIKIIIDNKEEEILLSNTLLGVKDKYIRLRELSIWYRKWAKERKYKKGIYTELQQTKEWKEARKIWICIYRYINHLPSNSFLNCNICLQLKPEWNLLIHHKEYDWEYIFENGIKLICQNCHKKIHKKI